MLQAKENGTPEKRIEDAEARRKEFEDAVNSAGSRLVQFILQDEEMMKMNKYQLGYSIDRAKRTIERLFDPQTLREALDMVSRRDAATSDHRAE